jgi:hypothetical protein
MLASLLKTSTVRLKPVICKTWSLMLLVALLLVLLVWLLPKEFRPGMLEFVLLMLMLLALEGTVLLVGSV